MYGTYSLVQGEAVVDASRQGNEVPLVHGDADPSVLLVPDVKVGLAIQDVADFIIQVQVLLKEHLQLTDTKRQRGLNSGGFFIEFLTFHTVVAVLMVFSSPLTENDGIITVINHYRALY